MQFRQIFIVLLVVLLLSSCATTAKYKAVLDTWIGHHYDSLLSSWGPPTSTADLSNGGKVVEYYKETIQQSGGYTYSVPVKTIGTYSGTQTTYIPHTSHVTTQQIWCKTRFVLNEALIIQTWSFEGNGCRSR